MTSPTDPPPPESAPESAPKPGLKPGLKAASLSTTDDVRARMSRQRSKDTGVEVALRRELHRMGLRYRVHRRPLKGVRREADVVFGPTKVAVYVDGCFWHGCPVHATWPKRNAEFWKNKIEGNRARDLDTDRRMADAGWLVVRVWEHENAIGAAARVRDAVTARRAADKRTADKRVRPPH